MIMTLNRIKNIAPIAALSLAWGLLAFLSAGALRAQQTREEGLLLSVQEFQALGVDPSLAASVSDMLRSELARSGRLTLLEETGRLYKMQRQSARFRDLVDERSLRRLGELLESRYVLTGSVSRLDSLFIITARVVDSETGEVRASESVQQSGGVAGVAPAVRSLARAILAHFPLTARISGVRGDTLTAEAGLEDGLLPGQELTVAELDPAERSLPAWAQRPARSARYRVADAEARSCRLTPVMKVPGGPLGQGAWLVLEGSGLNVQKTEGSGLTGHPSLGASSGPTGGVLIESEPSGALVWISGLDAGRTPVRMEDLAAGRHPLQIGLEGYKEIDDSVNVVTGKLTKYKFSLERRTGRLTIITSQPDVSVRVDTLTFQVQGTGRITLQDFAEGTHRIVATCPGYEAWQKTVEVAFDRDSTLSIELTPYPGSLVVRSNPAGADIFLDGVRLGPVTPWSLTRLPAGPHTLSLRLTGYGSANQAVTVEPGKDKEISLELERGNFDLPPEGMALVPAGNLLTESGEEVSTDSFYIDLHEVTNRQYAFFVSSTKRKAPAGWKGGAAPAGEEDYPATGVSWEDAAAFALWSGKRLPTETEWERAGMDTRERAFPWGESYIPGSANIWSEGHGGPQPAGSFPKDRSRFGALDLVGNVAEWVEAWTDSTRLYRVFRGGSYYVNQEDPSLLSRDGLYPVSSNRYVGFRCARDLHPAD